MKPWLKDKLLKQSFPSALRILTPHLIQEALLLVTHFLQNKRTIVIIKENESQAQQLKTLMESLDENLNIHIFELEDPFRVQALASSPESLYRRLFTYYQIIHESVDILITTINSVTRKIPSKQDFISHEIKLTEGQQIDISQLENLCQNTGYQKVLLVNDPLSYAKRGGVFDVYSIQYDYPIRIEFFDDEIETIKFFDPFTQQSVTKIKEVTLFPASDLLLDIRKKEAIKNEFIKQNCTGESILEVDQFVSGYRHSSFYKYYALTNESMSVFDYFQDSFTILSPIEKLEVNYELFEKETKEYILELIEEKQFIPCKEIIHPLSMVYSNSSQQFTRLLDGEKNNFGFVSLPQISLENHLQNISKLAMTKKVILSLDSSNIKKVEQELTELEIPYEKNSLNLLENGIYLEESNFISGFEIEDIIVYSSYELFRVTPVKTKYGGLFQHGIDLDSIAQLEKGDFIVHKQYGIGKYIGLTTKEILGKQKDFIELEYANQDTLLVPLEQFNLIRKYVSSQAVNIKLHKLGTSAWNKTKEKIANSINDIADELIEIYQKRSKQKGFAFSKDNELQKQFEDEFPYPLTKDQEIAISEMKKDMESIQPMDRLLCGDVGFGKTEVAIRGAFKAIVDHKQVAFLCPTTVLSSQHYKTIKNRYKNFPVTIELLNRFTPLAKVKEIIKNVKEGKVDFLIGTHRILSQDIEFKDLGLLIIDEEQRFGVLQKEKIKKLKSNIDVLSLSATPIPRTLQMSLIGIRSLSQLNTPPANRYPVLTHVVEKEEKLIYSIIDRELSRGGQVFYLYNNTSTIFGLGYKLQKQFPHVKVGVAHGKMSREEIEDVMFDFNENNIQILVCTTIVETGIDIPNANTMIIEHAENFGLSQLYQIKGRVGRGDKVAYAYLLVPKLKQLSEIAAKRLQAIKEFTTLGSGYKIAMRDLTIRGAGEILGGQQSGFIDSVGIDLYLELLQEAIALKQQNSIELNQEKKKLVSNYDSVIPDEYVESDALKIDLYQQIDRIKTLDQLATFVSQTQDRYGKFSHHIQLLIEKKELELFYEHDWIEEYRDKPKEVQIIFSKEFSSHIDGVKLFETVEQVNSNIKLKYLSGKIEMMIPKSRETLFEIVTIIKRMKHEN